METHCVFSSPHPPLMETHGVSNSLSPLNGDPWCLPKPPPKWRPVVSSTTHPPPSSYASSSNEVLACFAVCCLSQTCVICCEGPHNFLTFKDEKKGETKKTRGHKFTRFSELIALNYILINVTCICVTFIFHL